jgi:hypothetical protein
MSISTGWTKNRGLLVPAQSSKSEIFLTLYLALAQTDKTGVEAMY